MTLQMGGASSNTPSVDSTFVNYQSDSLGHLTQVPISPELRKVLQKVLASPVGKRIAAEAHSQGQKIAVALEPSNARLLYQWDREDSVILYTMNLGGFKATYDRWGELKGAGMDTVIVHELGHTPYAAKAFGYPYNAGYWQNEFNAVRHIENPYRAFIGLPLRTTYGGVAIPPPLKQ